MKEVKVKDNKTDGLGCEYCAVDFADITLLLFLLALYMTLTL